jgi:hypothetical protein
MDSIRGRCSRQPCRYFHPPEHLAASLALDLAQEQQQQQQHGCSGPAFLIATGAVFLKSFSFSQVATKKNIPTNSLNKRTILLHGTDKFATTTKTKNTPPYKYFNWGVDVWPAPSAQRLIVNFYPVQVPY